VWEEGRKPTGVEHRQSTPANLRLARKKNFPATNGGKRSSLSAAETTTEEFCKDRQPSRGGEELFLLTFADWGFVEKKNTKIEETKNKISINT
jgi:hypothetical protein